MAAAEDEEEREHEAKGVRDDQRGDCARRRHERWPKEKGARMVLACGHHVLLLSNLHEIVPSPPLPSCLTLEFRSYTVANEWMIFNIRLITIPFLLYNYI